MKRDDKLFSIGEIAKALGVTRRIILHYEERGLIEPDKRDDATNNRYYTIDTFTKLRSIRSLQNLGLTLDEIRDYYNDSTDLMPLIRRMEEMRDQLNLNIEKLYERAKVSSAQVKELELPQQLIYRRTYRSNNVADKTVLLRNTALEAMRAHGTDITRRMYFIQFPIDRPAEVSFCVAVPPGSEGEYVETTAPMRAICIYHHGAYEELPAVGRQLLDYAKEHGLTPQGILRLWPHHVRGEGHFVALLEKDGDASPALSAPPLPAPDRAALQAYAAFADETGCVIVPNAVFGGHLIHAPAVLPPLDRIRTLRVGLQVGELRGKVFIPDHAMALGTDIPRQYPLTDAQALAYLHGEALPCDETMRGFYTVTMDGYALGFCKASNGQLKNHYPKGLRK